MELNLGATDRAESRLGRRRRLYATCLLYFCSGLPYGLIVEAMPLYLRAQGASLVLLGQLNWVQLPWSLKPLFGPAVDRLGSRLGWVRLALFGLALAEGLLAATMETSASPSAPLRVGLMAAIVLAAALQDVAVDGIFVQWWQGPAVGIGNGARTSSYRVAMVLGGVGTAWLGSLCGWRVPFAAWSAITLGMALATLAVPSAGAKAPASVGEFWRGLRAWLQIPGMRAVVLFAFLYRLGDFCMAGMVRPFWLDQGIPMAEIATANSGLGIGFGLLGGLGGSLYVAKYGLVRGLWHLGLLQALSNLGYAGVAAAGGGRLGLYAAACVENLAQGLGSAALLVLFTQMCQPAQGATQFAALSALLGLSRLASGHASGIMAESWGYGPYFLATFMLALPAFVLLPAVQRFLAEAPKHGLGATAEDEAQVPEA